MEWTPKSVQAQERLQTRKQQSGEGSTCRGIERVSGCGEKGVWSESPDPSSALLEASQERTVLTELGFYAQALKAALGLFPPGARGSQGAGGVPTLRKTCVGTRRYGLTRVFAGEGPGTRVRFRCRQ